MYEQLYKHTMSLSAAYFTSRKKRDFTQKYVTVYHFNYGMFTFHTVGLYQEFVCV